MNAIAPTTAPATNPAALQVKPDTVERVFDSALALFRTEGFAGASIREIAAGAKVALGTMAHYFPNKVQILDRLLNRIIDSLREEIDSTLEHIEKPQQQLISIVRVLVVSHCERSNESFVAISELRNLPPDRRAVVIQKRLEVQRVVTNVVERGVAQGIFDVTSPRTAAIAVLTLCTSVATWYRPGGPQTPQELATHYQDYASAIVRSR